MDRLMPWNFEYGPGPIAPEYELPPQARCAVVRYEEVNANMWRRILNSNALLLLMWLSLMISGTIVFAITSVIVNVDKAPNPDAVTAKITNIVTSMTATVSMDMTATPMVARGGKSQIPFWEANFEVNYFLPNAVIPSPKRTFGPFDF